MKRHPDLITMDIEPNMRRIIDERTEGMVRNAMLDHPDSFDRALAVVRRSAYIQGLADGADSVRDCTARRQMAEALDALPCSD